MNLVFDIGDELSCKECEFRGRSSICSDCIHDRVCIAEPSSDIAYNDTKVSIITPMQFPTELVPMQCTSCGAAIDKDTMTCKHCGMTFMLR